MKDAPARVGRRRVAITVLLSLLLSSLWYSCSEGDADSEAGPVEVPQPISEQDLAAMTTEEIWALGVESFGWSPSGPPEGASRAGILGDLRTSQVILDFAVSDNEEPSRSSLPITGLMVLLAVLPWIVSVLHSGRLGGCYVPFVLAFFGCIGCLMYMMGQLTGWPVTLALFVIYYGLFYWFDLHFQGFVDRKILRRYRVNRHRH
jgi:hypothetical protein